MPSDSTRDGVEYLGRQPVDILPLQSSIRRVRIAASRSRTRLDAFGREFVGVIHMTRTPTNFPVTINPFLVHLLLILPTETSPIQVT
jgi:hypothetical protein